MMFVVSICVETPLNRVSTRIGEGVGLCLPFGKTSLTAYYVNAKPPPNLRLFYTGCSSLDFTRSLGANTPFSVMIASTNSAGVTSKAGL